MGHPKDPTSQNAKSIRSPCSQHQTKLTMISKSSALSLFLALASTSPRDGNAFSSSSMFSRNDKFAVGIAHHSPTSVSVLFATTTTTTKKKIFIDGEAGTTGLQVRDRLAGRADLEIISISDELRKDVNERKRLINEADCVILCEWCWWSWCCLLTGTSCCELPLLALVIFMHISDYWMAPYLYWKFTGLPDDASKEAASMVDNDRTVVIDASTAFRVDDNWTYGFPGEIDEISFKHVVYWQYLLYSDFIHFSTRPPAPKSTIIELSKSQKEEIQSSKRISNPGCYPTGFIALIRPLVAAGIIPPDAPLTVNAISGYSGGGKGLIEIYESDEHEPWGSYGYSMVSSNEQGFCPWIHLLPIVIWLPIAAHSLIHHVSLCCAPYFLIGNE